MLQYRFSIALHAFFISNTFPRLKIAKTQVKAKQNPEAELFLLETISTFLLFYPKLIWDTLRNAQKTSICFNEIIWLIIMKIRLKVKNESHRCDINRTRPKRGYKCTEDKMCLMMMIVMSNKQHLSNT